MENPIQNVSDTLKRIAELKHRCNQWTAWQSNTRAYDYLIDKVIRAQEQLAIAERLLDTDPNLAWDVCIGAETILRLCYDVYHIASEGAPE